MTVTLITPPLTGLGPVVTVFEANARLRLEADEVDGDLPGMISAATRSIEAATGRAMLESTWEWRLRDFPCGEYIELPKFQVQSASVSYIDSTGATLVFPPSFYRLEGLYDPDTCATAVTHEARLVLKYGNVWPTAALENGSPVIVSFVCGWDEPASVPDDLKTAILLETGHLYRHRESVTTGRLDVQSRTLARGVDTYIERFRDTRFQ